MSRFTGLWLVVACLCFGCSGGIDKTSLPGAARPVAGAGHACVPGIQLACQCGDGSLGVAVCDDGGMGFESCTCPDGRSVGMPAVIFPDAPDQTGSAASPGVKPAPVPELARGIGISELAFYQTVKIPVMRDGAAIEERNAPIVIGKDAMLRVFVEPLPGFQAREIVAELELVSGTASTSPALPMQLTLRVERSSDDASLASTFNFAIPAASVTPGVRYAVTLRETGAAPAGMTADASARWPRNAAERAALGARDAGPLRIMLVPYRYTADGSDRLPASDDAEIENYKRALRAMYPASELQLELHEPVDFEGTIGPTSGWSQWLEFHCDLRAREAPDPKVLYYGTIAPRQNFRAYGGGIVGVSPVPSAAGNYGRCSVGIGFAGFASTMTHELGHALGLEHAPCGTDGGPFPYADAKIGSWGIALRTSTLIEPGDYYDVMSYCDPVFISDYNYQRLFERIRYLNLQFDLQPGNTDLGPGSYRRILVDTDGQATLRGNVDLAQAPGGSEDSHALTLVDAEGRAMGETQAFFFPFSEPGAGLWLVPDGTPGSGVRIAGSGDVGLR